MSLVREESLASSFKALEGTMMIITLATTEELFIKEEAEEDKITMGTRGTTIYQQKVETTKTTILLRDAIMMTITLHRSNRSRSNGTSRVTTAKASQAKGLLQISKKEIKETLEEISEEGIKENTTVTLNYKEEEGAEEILSEIILKLKAMLDLNLVGETKMALQAEAEVEEPTMTSTAILLAQTERVMEIFREVEELQEAVVQVEVLLLEACKETKTGEFTMPLMKIMSP